LLGPAKTTDAALINDAGLWWAERLRVAAAEASNAVIERLQEETAKAQRTKRTALHAACAAAAIGAVVVAAIVGFWPAAFAHS